MWNLRNKEIDTTVSFILKNDECKKLIEDFMRNDLPTVVNILIIFQPNQDDFYIKHTDVEHQQITHALDELHFKALKGELS